MHRVIIEENFRSTLLLRKIEIEFMVYKNKLFFQVCNCIWIFNLFLHLLLEVCLTFYTFQYVCFVV